MHPPPPGGQGIPLQQSGQDIPLQQSGHLVGDKYGGKQGES